MTAARVRRVLLGRVQRMTAYDTEKPPHPAWRPRVNHPTGHSWGPDIQLDFTANPEAAQPFFDWLKSNEAWAAFGDWYDTGNFRKYEAAP